MVCWCLGVEYCDEMLDKQWLLIYPQRTPVLTPHLEGYRLITPFLPTFSISTLTMLSLSCVLTASSSSLRSRRSPLSLKTTVPAPACLPRYLIQAVRVTEVRTWQLLGQHHWRPGGVEVVKDGGLDDWGLRDPDEEEECEEETNCVHIWGIV